MGLNSNKRGRGKTPTEKQYVDDDRRRGRRLSSQDDIIEYLKQEHENGNSRPSFTLVAESEPGPTIDNIFDGANIGDAETRYEIDLIEANPSVTKDTIISSPDGSMSVPFSDFDSTEIYIFVAANHQHSSGDFALVVVDVKAQRVDGLARRGGAGGKLVKLHQAPGKSTIVSKLDEADIPEDWECGASHELGSDTHQHAKENFKGQVLSLSDHHHVGHDNHAEHGDFLSASLDNVNAIFGTRRRRSLYPTDKFPQLYSYEVDLFIQIDQELVDQNNGNFSMAVAYVNALVTAASVIYEEEVDTHCELF